MRMFTTYANDSDTALAAALTVLSPADFVIGSGNAAGSPDCPTAASAPTLTIDSSRPRQHIDGFGASLTQASATLISSLPEPARTSLLEELMSVRNGIGLSMLRQPVGPSDHVTRPYRFTRRMPDPRLRTLDFSCEEREIIPLLEQAYGIRAAEKQPLNLIVTPWSAPAWMKTNRSIYGQCALLGTTGYLRPRAYAVYAEYLARFIELYRAHGLDVFGITPTNEPDYPQSRWPSMAMTPAQQARFIGDFLAPCLRAHSLEHVRIMCWDHNYSTDHYPDGRFVRELYTHPRALAAVAGSAWHYYGGASITMADIHRMWPDKGLWVTEASGGDWGPRNWDNALVSLAGRIIAMMNNWAQSVVLWNIALDEHGGPDYFYLRNDRRHSQNRGILTIDSHTGAITRNADYYALAHFSRFLQPGATVLASALANAPGIHAAAFRATDNRLVAVIVNEHGQPCPLSVTSDAGDTHTVRLPARSLSTLLLD